MRPGTFRVLSTGVLTVLVIVSLVMLGSTSFLLLQRQAEATQQLLRNHLEEGAEADRELRRAEAIALRTLKLEARRLRLSNLVETCVVLRLEGQHLPRCRRIRGEAKRLAKVIHEFRDRLGSDVQGGGGTTTNTVTHTRTRTVTRTPPPSVGNSDQCPPNNPHC